MVACPGCTDFWHSIPFYLGWSRSSKHQSSINVRLTKSNLFFFLWNWLCLQLSLWFINHNEIVLTLKFHLYHCHIMTTRMFQPLLISLSVWPVDRSFVLETYWFVGVTYINRWLAGLFYVMGGIGTLKQKCLLTLGLVHLLKPLMIYPPFRPSQPLCVGLAQYLSKGTQPPTMSHPHSGYAQPAL